VRLSARVLVGAIAVFSIGTALVQPARAGAVVPAPPAPACTTTPAGISLPPVNPAFDVPPSAGLTATDNHGLWAGIRSDSNFNFQVITWRAGSVKVLDTIHYRLMTETPTQNLRVVGITGSGAVIVDSMAPQLGTVTRHIGYAYQYGKRFPLAHRSDWLSWQPTGVSTDGHISGLVRTRTNTFVVDWHGAFSEVAVASGQVQAPLVDGLGDLMWYQTVGNYAAERYLTATGHYGELIDRDQTPYITAAAGRWAWSSTGSAVDVYDLTQARGGSLLPVRQLHSGWPVAGAASGEFLQSTEVPYLGSYYFYDAYFDSHRVPAAISAVTEAGIADDGTVAFTGTNGSVYFYRCPLNYGAHNPRGLMYRGAVVNGQTVLAGGAFDADDRTAHIQVDLYHDGKFLVRVTADQTDVWFGHTFGVGPNYRYRYTLTPEPGRHTYCAYGLNLGYGNHNTQLGCTVVTA